MIPPGQATSCAADHWHILGAGAIGTVCAAALLEGGQDVSLVLRDGAAVNHWRQSPGLQLTDSAGQTRRLQPGVVAAHESGPIGHLLITTKAHQAARALAPLRPWLSAETVVVLLVNGLGVAEELLESRPGLNLFLATTTEGAHRTGPHAVQRAGRGTTLVGRADTPDPPRWFSPWCNGELEAEWCENIQQRLWRKLAVNCAINGLTAIHRCRNGELANPTLAPHVQALCQEIAEVLRAEGMGPMADSLQGEVFSVIAATADNRSSMLQDVSAGRPTEIDYLNGHLLRVAGKHGLDLPRNRELVAQL